MAVQSAIGATLILVSLSMLPILASPEGMSEEQLNLLAFITIAALGTGMLLVQEPAREQTFRTA
jgi:hypothetical protein